MATTVCPPGIPQVVCDITTATLQTAQTAGTTPSNYDANDIFHTFLQWYPAVAASRQLPATLPNDISLYGAGPLGNILASSANYWQNIGSKNPELARSVDLSTFPWQYVKISSTDPITIVQSVLDAMYIDPKAKSYLVAGKLPPFDPAELDYTGIWSNPTLWPAATQNVAKVVPALNTFIQKGILCNIFAQPKNVVDQMWINFITYGGNPNDPRGNPCSFSIPVYTPLPPTPAPPVIITNPAPTPTPTPGPIVVVQPSPPVPTQTPVIVTQSSLPSWAPAVFAVAGIGLLGALAYYVTRPRITTSAPLIGPVSESNPRKTRKRRKIKLSKKY